MSKAETLVRVDNDISRGDLGKARDRLNSLSASFPDDLEIRNKLGEIYWKLQFPEMAGRYWYLELNKSQDMITACQAFEKSKNNKYKALIDVLNYHGRSQSLEGIFDQEAIAYWEKMEEERIERIAGRHKEKTEKKQSKFGCAIAYVLVAAICILSILGIYQIINWIK